MHSPSSMQRLPAEEVRPLLDALAHPVRAQVLAILADRNASATEIAEAIGEPRSKVRYHLRALAKSGLIGCEGAKNRRGAREYYWVSRTRQLIEDDQCAELSDEQIQMVTLYILRLAFSDASAGIREGSFTRRHNHCVTRFRPVVDEQGWKELVKVYRAAIAGIEAVSERASKRLAKSEAEPVPVSASLLLFDLEEPARPLPANVPPFEYEQPQ